MKHFSRTLVIAALAIQLGGCGLARNIYDVATTATVSPTAVVVAASAFDAAEVTATNYLRAKRCNGTNGPVCRDSAVTPTIIGSIRAGRVARNNLKAFLRAHPGELGPKGDYDALVTATNTIQSATAAYQSAVK